MKHKTLIDQMLIHLQKRSRKTIVTNSNHRKTNKKDEDFQQLVCKTHYRNVYLLNDIILCLLFD